MNEFKVSLRRVFEIRMALSYHHFRAHKNDQLRAHKNDQLGECLQSKVEVMSAAVDSSMEMCNFVLQLLDHFIMHALEILVESRYIHLPCTKTKKLASHGITV